MAFPQGSIPGIDVSHEQGAVDWAAVASGGEVFAYAKATEGITWTDIYFHDNWQGMKTAGLLRGAYHYFLPADDPGAQATNFLNLLTKANGSATLAPGDLPAMLDLEVTQGVSTATILTNVQSWMNQVQAETGRLPLLYTNPNFWKNMLGNPTDLAQYPLWIARYGVASPGTFGGWSDWTIWQFSESYNVQGISGPVDADGYQGPLATLQTLAGIVPIAADADETALTDSEDPAEE